MGKTLEAQTIGSYVIPKDAGFTSGDSVSMEVYGSDGMIINKYAFVDSMNVDSYGLTKPGWYPFDPIYNYDLVYDEDCVNETFTIPAGKLVIITNNGDDTMVTLPSPLK